MTEPWPIRDGKTIKIDRSEGEATAWALKFLNDTFDSLNAPAKPDEKEPPLRQLITPKSIHREFWITALRYLRKIDFVNRKTGLSTRATEHCLRNSIMTIEGFQRITQTLFDMGFETICPRYFSTDCVENFFAGLRKLGVTNTSPTCKQYEGSHKTMLINNLTSAKAVGSNCEEDDCDSHLLVSLKKLFKQNLVEVKLYANNTIIILILNLFLIKSSFFY